MASLKQVTYPTWLGASFHLLEQIRKFGAGERKDPFMQGLIKVLNDEERAQITLYYANVKVPPAKADPAHTQQGKVLFEKLCARCHGAGALGTEIYPRLAGHNGYLLKRSLLPRWHRSAQQPADVDCHGRFEE